MVLKATVNAAEVVSVFIYLCVLFSTICFNNLLKYIPKEGITQGETISLIFFRPSLHLDSTSQFLHHLCSSENLLRRNSSEGNTTVFSWKNRVLLFPWFPQKWFNSFYGLEASAFLIQTKSDTWKDKAAF